MTALVDVSTTTPPIPAATTITALVITTHETTGLELLLDALADQTLIPERVLVLDRTAGHEAAAAVDGMSLPYPVEARAVDPTRSMREAVRDHAATDAAELVWVLPCGVTPAPDALAALLAPHRRSPVVAITGPKIVSSADPHILRSAGIQVTRTGRTVATPAPGEQDQHQYDARRDVLAVPAAGALINASVLRDLGGWEASFGDLGGDLDLGWRSQLTGRRVELVPSARVLAASGIGSADADTGARRRAVRRVALARTAWWAAPFLALWILLGALVSGAVLLLLKRPWAAAVELGDLGALDPVRWLGSRWRTRTRITVRRRHLTGLFVPPATVRRRLLDAMSESLFPSRDRHPAAPESERSTLVRMLTNPGLLAVLATVASVTVAARSLGTAPLRGLSGGLVGGELLGGRADAAALWSAWADGWTGGGLGHAGSGSPHLAALAALTAIVELVPGLGSLASPAGALVATLFVLTPVLAAISCYLAARALTSNRWLRAAAAWVWATGAAAGPAYAQGRLGALVVLVLLPLVGAGLVALARADGTATSAWATALGLAVLGAFAPAVAATMVIVALLLAVGGVDRNARRRALVPLLIAPAALLLWWPGVLDDPRQLLAGPGLTQWGGSSPPDWQLALGHVGGAGSPPVWSFAPLVVLGVLGLLRGRAVRSAGTALGLLALLALAGALAAPRIRLADVPAIVTSATAPPQPVTPWAGQMILVLTLALLAAAVWGLGGLLAAQPSRWARPGRAAAGVFAVGLTVTTAAGLVGTGLGGLLVPWHDPRPAVAIEHADGTLAGRTLFVTTTERGPAFRIVGRETAGPARGIPSAPSPGEERAADTVSALLDGGQTAASAAALRGLAVGFVAVTDRLGEGIERTLDATEGLTRLAPRDGWLIWRVAPGADALDAPVGPPRVRLVGPDGSRSIPVTGSHAALATEVSPPRGATLVVSEPSGWAATARVTLDGRPLIAIPGGAAASPAASAPTTAEGSGAATTVAASDRHPGEIAYPVPDRGLLSITLRRGPTWLPGAQLAALVILIFLAVPFGSRESRRRS